LFEDCLAHMNAHPVSGLTPNVLQNLRANSVRGMESPVNCPPKDPFFSGLVPDGLMPDFVMRLAIGKGHDLVKEYARRLTGNQSHLSPRAIAMFGDETHATSTVRLGSELATGDNFFL
jgi:hypothetical protein